MKILPEQIGSPYDGEVPRRHIRQGSELAKSIQMAQQEAGRTEEGQPSANHVHRGHEK